jgi:hypothetical protein
MPHALADFGQEPARHHLKLIETFAQGRQRLDG